MGTRVKAGVSNMGSEGFDSIGEVVGVCLELARASHGNNWSITSRGDEQNTYTTTIERRSWPILYLVSDKTEKSDASRTRA